VESPVPSVYQVLSTIDGRYDYVLGEKGIYMPSLPPVFNTLTELHSRQGYYLRLTGPTSANALVEGLSVPVTTPLSLHTGWNWIGYLPRATLPITVALQSIEGQYQRVLSLDETYDPALPQFSTLHTMEPGQGYLIYVTDSITLVYPNEVAGMASHQVQNTTMACSHVSPTPYLTLFYGQVEINGQLAPAGAMIEAITPRGDVAGCFSIEKPGLLGFVHVYGEDATATPPISGFRPGEQVRFRVNNLPAESSHTYLWQDDPTPRSISLNGNAHALYLPLVLREQ
jgi:hypothetical protein